MSDPVTPMPEPTQRDRICARNKVMVVLLAIVLAALASCLAFGALPYGAVYAALLVAFPVLRHRIIQHNSALTHGDNNVDSNVVADRFLRSVLMVIPACICMGYFISSYHTVDFHVTDVSALWG